MKPMIIRPVLLTILVVTASLTGTNVSAQTTAGEHADNAILTSRVKLALVEHSVRDAADIDVTSYKGIVQLSGFVDDQEAITTAVQIAEGVDGVETVSNRLKIKSGKRTPGRALDDGILAARVKLALAENPDTPVIRINVEVRAGVVELSGFVDSYDERNKAVELVAGLDGVEDVINSIDIAP